MNAYRFLVGKTERKGPLGRPRNKFWDNIEICFREIEWAVTVWIQLAQDSDQWWAPVSKAVKFRFQ